MRFVESAVENILRKAMTRRGYALTRLGSDYINAGETVRAAKEAGLSLHEYLYRHDSAYKAARTDRIVGKISDLFDPQYPISVIEIGTGTGIYLERLLPKVNCNAYHVFETDSGWKDYIRQTFADYGRIHVHECDGCTLKEVKGHTIDLVHAHAVFVYTPTLTTLNYLQEASRVLKLGGYLVFDCFLETEFDEVALAKWLASEHRFPVVLPTKLLSWQMRDLGLCEISRFDEVYGPHRDNYLILRKAPSEGCT